MPSYLFPTALIENMVGAELSSAVLHDSTEYNKWSKSGAGLSIRYDYDTYKIDRRSIEIVYSNDADEYIIRGNEVLFDDTSINNPFGSDVTDPSLYTNIGCWIYMEDDLPSAFDKFEFQIEGSGDVNASVSSYVDGTGKWLWWDGIVDLSAISSWDNFKITLDAGGEAGTLYLNNINLFKRSCSNIRVPTYSGSSSYTAATNNFSWKNGIGFIMTKMERNVDNQTISISGQISGINYVNESMDQLEQMITKDLIVSPIIERPFPKLTTINDYGKVKTYLLYHTSTNETFPGQQPESVVEPVVIQSLKIRRPKKRTNRIEFDMVLVRYGGL